MTKLLILCTGNTCRSPMAGVLARSLLQEHEHLQVEIRTAGISAFPGSPASSHAVEVMKEKGLDLTTHMAESVTQEVINWADLILTMTWEHKKKLLQKYPEVYEKVFTLREYGEPMPEAQRGAELMAIITRREQDFLASHQEELDRLLERQQELRREMQALEAELATWQHRFAEEVVREQQELLTLERELRGLDIVDPFGGTAGDYQKAAQEIEKALELVLRRLASNHTSPKETESSCG